MLRSYVYNTLRQVRDKIELLNIRLQTFLQGLIITIHFFFRVISSYRKSYVEVRGNVPDLYSNKIFCGWDFSISSSKIAALQSASIYKELEELLAETRLQMHLHWFAKCSLLIMQLGVTAIVLFMICGAGALIWTLLGHHDLEAPGTISVMIVPTVITIIIHIFPTIISYLVSIFFFFTIIIAYFDRK